MLVVNIGSDPEFWVKDAKGNFIASSEIIKDGDWEGIIRDGLAVELNPFPETCRQIAFNSISNLMLNLMDFLPEGYSLSFETKATFKKRYFNKLSDKEKQLGCQPSHNIYGEFRIPPEIVNENVRYGGGHIHLGYNYAYTDNNLLKEIGVDDIVRMLDIVCGNTLVMFDQSKGSTERRKYYGRAGEYRLKSYGLEYRVPSNFWLKDYKLFGLATGLARLALNISVRPLLRKRILGAVNQDDIIKAINDNDYDLALSNYKKIEGIIASADFYNSPINLGNSDKMLYLLENKIKVPCTFPRDNYGSGYHFIGFEKWLSALPQKNA